MRFSKGPRYSKPQRLRFQAERAALAAGKSDTEAKAAGDAAFYAFDKTAWDEEKRKRRETAHGTQEAT